MTPIAILVLLLWLCVTSVALGVLVLVAAIVADWLTRFAWFRGLFHGTWWFGREDSCKGTWYYRPLPKIPKVKVHRK